MSAKAWVEPFLSSNHVAFSKQYHKPTLTSLDVAKVEHMDTSQVAKVVVSMDEKKRPALLVVPADRNIDLSKAKKSLKMPHLRLASENEMAEQFPDCEIGAVPPLKHWENVPVFVDDEGFSKDVLMFQAGSHRESVLLSYTDWVNFVQPVNAKFSAKEDEGKVRRRMSGYQKFWLWFGIAILAALTLFGTALLSSALELKTGYDFFLTSVSVLASISIVLGYTSLAITLFVALIAMTFPLWSLLTREKLSRLN